MNPVELLKTIYLGDRSIKKIVIDGWNEKVAIQCDLISKIPPNESSWEFYDGEDIENGFLIFNHVNSIRILPIGAIADDYISSINIIPIDDKQLFLASIFVGGYNCQKNRCEVKIEIEFVDWLIEKKYDEV
jgi:hypothetical protein